MGATRLLVANRGEIAIRILRAAAELGLRTVAVHSADDAASLHVRRGRRGEGARPATGAAAYLDIDAVVAAARETGCDAIHPGYGFLAENAAFARRCAEAGLDFVGPLARGARAVRRQGGGPRASPGAAACAGAGRHRRPHLGRGGRAPSSRPGRRRRA